jgi:hypothetical protein
VQAIELLREVTGKTAANPERTWHELEERLRGCDRSALNAIARQEAA